MNTDTEIPITSTLCHNCVFAEYNNEDVQIGCKANRIEKYKQANIPVLELKAENKTGFVIKGKTCVYYRNKQMMDFYHKNKSVDDMLIKVKKQLLIPYHAIVFVRSTDSLKDVESRLSELENQKVKPKILTIVDRSHKHEDISGRLIMMCQENYSFDHWRIQRVQAIDQIDTDVIDLIYDSTKQLKYMFYITLECSQKIPPTMSEEIHKSLHDDMKSFTILLPNSNNVGRGALKVAHAKHAGNSFAILLEDKIRHYNDAPHLIKKVEEICPSLQTS